MTLLAGNPFPSPFGESIGIINPAWLYVPNIDMVIPVPGGQPDTSDTFWLYVPMARIICSIRGT